MKRTLLLICTLLCANVLFAQEGNSVFSNPTIGSSSTPPMKDLNWTQSFNGDTRSTELRGTPPISPATLLLLGLGGATVGFRVLNNKRKE